MMPDARHALRRECRVSPARSAIEAREKEPRHHGGRDRGQREGDPLTVQSRDVHQPRSGPQPLHGQQRAVAQRRHRHHAPERRGCASPRRGRRSAARGIPVAARCSLRCLGTTMNSTTAMAKPAMPGEHVDTAPVRVAEQRLDRRRGGQRAQPADRQHAAVDERQPLQRKPHGEHLERGHQAGGHAKPDEGTADDEVGHVVAEGEPHAAGPGDEQQHRLHVRGPKRSSSTPSGS